ncbi:hypothetical protein DPMN_028576 [Dreissena polymorpha]|uniref:EGF-like domain-containing protein n=1 Tax=Dreissena polymorpha TaxID=45954 RepID=A0A9D4LWY8_DREPO|nr:hypothetical protein DPMN_028576 [Dreissena polymorpha]
MSCEFNCFTQYLPLSSGIISCNKVSGNCDSGACVPGFFRPTCTSLCSSNCKDVVCELQSGNCTNGCNIGWFGRFCDGTCSANCVNRNCLGVADRCLEGCVPEKYGPQCDIPCNSNCLTGVCNVTGYCTRGCVPGWYGDMCERMCNSTCTDGRCGRTLGVCEECSKTNPSPLCKTSACPAGLTGMFCNSSCSSSFCDRNICGRYIGTCLGCVVGRYGDQCERQCDACLVGTTCQQVDGRCDECMPGYYGSFCRQSCTTCITCTKSTGLCTTCARGQYGELCQYNCSRACVPVRGIISCDIVTADCASGQCTAGYWDTDCFTSCSANCGRSNTTGLSSCDFLTGQCSSDCLSGWYGSHCDRKCESLCYDGRCDRNQGVCVECLNPNPDFNCPSGPVSSSTDSNNPDKHNDNTPLLAAAVGGSVGGFAAGVAIVIVIIVLRRRYRVTCPCQRREESGQQSENIDTYARINENARSQEGHMYAGLHANRNSEYDVVEPGHLETNMNQLHQGAYVPFDSRLRNEQIYNSLTSPQPQPNSEAESVESQL